MDEGMFDLLVREVKAQGHRVFTMRGVTVFTIGNSVVICRKVPTNTLEWRNLLVALTRAGLLWPPRKRR